MANVAVPTPSQEEDSDKEVLSLFARQRCLLFRLLLEALINRLGVCFQPVMFTGVSKS